MITVIWYVRKKKKAIDDLDAYKQRAQAGEIRLFLLDEIKLTLLATITRMWSKTGIQSQIRTDDNHDRCYGYTAIDWVSCKTHYRISTDFNATEFEAFISQIVKQYPAQTCVIALDNARPHGYFKLHGEVKVSNHLYFYFFPPYSAAELNPVEDVFRFFRHKVTHNHYFAQITDLIEAARNFFRYLYVSRNRVALLINRKV